MLSPVFKTLSFSWCMVSLHAFNSCNPLVAAVEPMPGRSRDQTYWSVRRGHVLVASLFAAYRLCLALLLAWPRTEREQETRASRGVEWAEQRALVLFPVTVGRSSSASRPGQADGVGAHELTKAGKERLEQRRWEGQG